MQEHDTQKAHTCTMTRSKDLAVWLETVPSASRSNKPPSLRAGKSLRVATRDKAWVAYFLPRKIMFPIIVATQRIESKNTSHYYTMILLVTGLRVVALLASIFSIVSNNS